MTKDIDFGKLTEQETLELAVEAMNELRLEERVKAVLKAFSKREREALRSDLEEDDEE